MRDTKNALDTVYRVVMEAFETQRRNTFDEKYKYTASAMNFDEMLRNLRKSVDIAVASAWKPNKDAAGFIATIGAQLTGVLDHWLRAATELAQRGSALNPMSVDNYNTLKKDLEKAFVIFPKRAA